MELLGAACGCCAAAGGKDEKAELALEVGMLEAAGTLTSKAVFADAVGGMATLVWRWFCAGAAGLVELVLGLDAWLGAVKPTVKAAPDWPLLTVRPKKGFGDVTELTGAAKGLKVVVAAVAAVPRLLLLLAAWVLVAVGRTVKLLVLAGMAAAVAPWGGAVEKELAAGAPNAAAGLAGGCGCAGTSLAYAASLRCGCRFAVPVAPLKTKGTGLLAAGCCAAGGTTALGLLFFSGDGALSAGKDWGALGCGLVLCSAAWAATLGLLAEVERVIAALGL